MYAGSKADIVMTVIAAVFLVAILVGMIAGCAGQGYYADDQAQHSFVVQEEFTIAEESHVGIWRWTMDNRDVCYYSGYGLACLSPR